MFLGIINILSVGIYLLLNFYMTILKNLNVSDLDSCSKKDFQDALHIVKDEKLQLKNLSDTVRTIVLSIVQLSKTFKLELQSSSLEEDLFYSLDNSNDLQMYWVSQKIKTIMHPLLWDTCPIQHNEAENKIKWINKIKEWLLEDKFIPDYQWIRDNKTWEINKYEALVRYSSNDEIISPFEFLHIAEDVWLLWKISESMIEQVLYEMKNHNFEISINLTEKDFLNDKLINRILTNVIRYDINPERLMVEILENITNDIDDTILQNILKLKELGIKISIDDFGTWYSNFARLIEIEPDFIKIDGSLIRWLKWKKNKKYWDIISAIVDFGHQQKAKLVAEYVEDEELQNIVEFLWIDYSQWYLYSKPSRDIIIEKKTN